MRKLVLIGAAFLMGCGGGGDAAAGGGDHRSDMRRACTSADRVLDRIPADASVDQLASAAAAWTGAARALAAVEPPAAERARHAEITTAAQDLHRALQKATGLASRDGRVEDVHETMVRARSAAQSLQDDARAGGIQGCADAVVAAVDRLLLPPYRAIVRHHAARYRRTANRIDFTPETAAEAGRSIDAFARADAAARLGIEVLEPPSAVAEEHARGREASDGVKAVLLHVFQKRVGLAQGRRVMARLAKVDRRIRRAHRALLAVVARAMR